MQTDEAISEAMRSIASQAGVRIGEREMEAQMPFIRAGQSAGSGMERAKNNAAVAEFKAIAREMVDKIREYDPADPARHDAALEAVARPIADVILQRRESKMAKGILNAGMRQKFAEQLRNNVGRIIDDALRDLRHQKLQHTGGNTYVAIGDVNAPLNVAVGQNNQAVQSITSDQFSALKEVLAAFRAAASDPAVPADVRLGVVDQVEVIEAELEKPQPDVGKVKRLSKWFVEKASGPAFVTALSRLFDFLAG